MATFLFDVTFLQVDQLG